MTERDDEGPPEGDTTATGGRTTAPQSVYELQDVAVGALIALAGLLVTVALPMVLI